ncbi:MAG: hypothetical protein H3Z53_08855 [archaeon]|nr:hypothetical protein [archaeon]
MNLSPAHYFERRILTTAPSITLKTRFPWEILATCMIMATSVFAMIWGFLTFPDLGIGASGLFGSSLIVIYYMLKERRKAWKVSGLS